MMGTSPRLRACTHGAWSNSARRAALLKLILPGSLLVSMRLAVFIASATGAAHEHRHWGAQGWTWCGRLTDSAPPISVYFLKGRPQEQPQRVGLSAQLTDSEQIASHRQGAHNTRAARLRVVPTSVPTTLPVWMPARMRIVPSSGSSVSTSVCEAAVTAPSAKRAMRSVWSSRGSGMPPATMNCNKGRREAVGREERSWFRAAPHWTETDPLRTPNGL